MATNHQLVEIILDQTLACQDPHSVESQSRHGGIYQPLGPYIPGDQGSYPTTDAAMEALAELADNVRENASDVKLAVSRDRMRMITSEVFGASLNELCREADRTKHWPILRKRIFESTRASGKDIVHYVPVWLFVGQECAPFNIGPIKFVPRSSWLGEIRRRRGKESPWMATVETLWSGGIVNDGSRWSGIKGAVTAFRRNRRSPHMLYQAYKDAKRFSEPTHVFHGRMVARLVHPDQWVGCCEVKGFETEESRRRGVLAVRVALDTIRLALVRPNRALISTAADSVQPLSIERLSQLEQRDLAHGFRINRQGVSGAPGLAKAILDGSRDLFDAAGACISGAASTSNQHACPNLAERWLNAVHWYGRACLADVDFVGVVMLVIALDVLSGGLEQKGILELVARLTGTAMSQQVLNDGTSLKQLVDRTYKLRSEVAHGSILAVHAQLDDARGQLEDLASAALDHYVTRLQKYADAGGIDDRDEFLKSLPAATP
ncbi:hypothetical protein HF206_30895 [Rhizobium leguminosarum]|uniref:HEPN domain-containing protein n=1 Tax=Rhizobium leguminosarum TaxID=384 RepID=UPI001C913303|nr:HEPN domain-containing protein [Rhizobium leguminosarum]MBY2918473.1 hypothetical protein [Rhizobium leguminosarum]